jgi:hypothetical protein
MEKWIGAEPISSMKDDVKNMAAGNIIAHTVKNGSITVHSIPQLLIRIFIRIPWKLIVEGAAGLLPPIQREPINDQTPEYNHTSRRMNCPRSS